MNNDKPWEDFVQNNFDSFVASLDGSDWIAGKPSHLIKAQIAECGQAAGEVAMRKVIKGTAMRRFESAFKQHLEEYESTLWSQYLTKNLKKFLRAIPQSEYHIEDAFLSDDEIEGWYSMTPVDLYKTLRIWVPQAYVKKFQNRYRAYKHRDVRKIQQFEISAKSKAILESYKDKIEADTLDEAIERCFSVNYQSWRDNETEYAKRDIANETAFSNEVFFKDLVERLTRSDRQKLALIIERSFKEGWNAAKTNRVRKGDPRQDALDNLDYIELIQLYLPLNDSTE